ncbi:MAG: chromosomal replication initiator protein DnaA [Bacteroidales bacterium]|jgi:chromosomal replication initiator protein|nr:chromosomal replication initiator protein DnaA [Bacteroidales bacterium]
MHRQIWDECMLIFKDNLEGSTFKIFFESIVPIDIKQNVLTIQVPSHFYREYLEEHYLDLLKMTLRRVIGPGARLEYRVPIGAEKMVTMPETHTKNYTNPPAPVSSEARINNPFAIPGLKKMDIDPHLNPEFTFDNLVEGECNKLARSAGLAIADKPGETSFNPLFIYGESGLGKTHLANAIGIRIKEQMPNKTVLYVNATEFKTQFVDASLYKNNVNNFLHFYQVIDVLIIDDVQEFGGKQGTQNTFFQIFNHLHQSHKQLILTSDRPPVDLHGLIDQRLLSRFKWGLSTELQIPDYTTRLEILKRRAYRDGVQLPDDVLEYVAKHVVDNVRELEGTLNGLLLQATIDRKAITLDLAQASIEKITKRSRREVTIEHILQLVADHYQIDKEQILSNTRKREIVQTRQLTMYLSKHFTKTSLKSIGIQLGGKDHATVLHALKAINNLKDTDPRFRMELQRFESQLDFR